MSTLHEVTAFAPGSVGNVAVGFDVFGLALHSPGDHVTVRRSDVPGITLLGVHGAEDRIPADADSNAAGVAIRALTERVRPDGDESTPGIEIELYKGLPLAGGMGGSAASAVAAVVAVDALLGAESSRELLLDCALEGERATGGARYPDNAAASLYGGFVIVREADPPDVMAIPVSEELSVVLAHPKIEIRTGWARERMPESVSMETAVRQMAHASTFVAALIHREWDRLARSFEDLLSEPVRGPMIPGFAAARAAALEAGALGCSVSGSGPSMFALCRRNGAVDEVANALHDTLAREADAEVEMFVSHGNAPGARVVASS